VNGIRSKRPGIECKTRPKVDAFGATKPLYSVRYGYYSPLVP